MANNHKNDVLPMTKSENADMVTMALKIFDYTPINLKDPIAVKKRIVDYFNECQRLGLRPGNMGLYSALGMSRMEAHNIIVGRDRNKVSPESCDMIKKAVRGMAAYRELLGSSGKINPITLLFWQKNYDGLADTQHLEITRADEAELQPTMSPEEIAQQIEADIPIDVDEAEIASVE